jgi:hypothetical protein
VQQGGAGVEGRGGHGSWDVRRGLHHHHNLRWLR